MRLFGRQVVSGAVVAVMALALVQVAEAQKFEPRSGQAGKDVVWVPTPQETVELMLDMAKLTPQDFHIDLGSGDGRTVITAAKRGSRALGIEYNPDMVALSIENAKTAGVTDRVEFRQADLFKTDFSMANVLTLFLLPDINLKIRPQILDMAPGTRIVSNTFMMGSGDDEWVPDETRRVEEDCVSWCTAHLWIVPAKVGAQTQIPIEVLTAGSPELRRDLTEWYRDAKPDKPALWTMNGQPLLLTQRFQQVTGILGGTQVITNGKLNGNSITFTAGGTTYTGTVSADGKTITGAGWSASR